MTYAAAPGKARSLTHCARLGIKPTSSWILIGFVSTEAQQELLFSYCWLFKSSLYILDSVLFFSPEVSFTNLFSHSVARLRMLLTGSFAAQTFYFILGGRGMQQPHVGSQLPGQGLNLGRSCESPDNQGTLQMFFSVQRLCDFFHGL